MKEDHVTGGVFTCMAFTIIALCLSLGSCTTEQLITSDCKDFGKFEIEDNWYTCEEVK